MLYLGELSALATALLWSASSFVFTAAIARVGSMQVNVTRMLIAAVLLAATIPILGIPLQVTASQFLFLALSGIAGLVFGDSFLFRAFGDIGPRYSMLIMALAPAFAAVLAYIFLDESLSFQGVAGIALTLCGIGIAVLGRRETAVSRFRITRKGVLYGIFGALGQGVGLIFAKVAFNEHELHGILATLIRVTVSAIIIVPVSMRMGWYRSPLPLLSTDRTAVLLMLAGAALGPYLGITLSLIAVANTQVGIAATIMALPPIIMLPLARMIYGERFSITSVAGAFLAVGGVALLFLRM